MKPTHDFLVFALAFAALLFASWPSTVFAQSSDTKPSRMPVGKILELKTPLGCPLFHSRGQSPYRRNHCVRPSVFTTTPQLSLDGSISCASCHAPQFLFPIIVLSPTEWVAKKGLATHQPLLTPPTSACSSGMAAHPASKNRPKARWRIPWRWLIPLMASYESSSRRQIPRIFSKAWGTDQIDHRPRREVHCVLRTHCHRGRFALRPFLLWA